MGDLGFWRTAEADPAHLALVGPDGTERTAGELLAASHRAANAFRALGLEGGDTVAVLLPNSIELIELYLGALEVGLYFTPINWHLVGPEVAYILQDSDAKVFVASERFAEVARNAAAETGFPAEASFSLGAVDGFRPLAELYEGQSDDVPDKRSTGAAMHYTSGTTGRPKGV
ncbi:MAG TPA: AMP-binding protein, partial [Acidimicrobiales bacterium]|nr:AMP-binding protein [Acidimicrobiales bacterium]